MKICVYTALYGGHSTLKEFDRRGVECVCYTDDPDLRSNTWKLLLGEYTPGPPRLTSKVPKMTNPLAAEFDLTIWIDSTITVTRMDRFVAECLAALEGHDIALFLHPERTSVCEEADASFGMSKYAGQNVLEQAVGYIREGGLPLSHRLYAGGVIARRAPMIEFGKAWLAEMEKSLQDQISLPYVLWKLGIEPGVIPGSVYGTDYHQHRWEGPDK